MTPATGDAVIHFTETSYVDAVWFVPFPGGDWMAVIFRDDATGPWLLRYRFRHHVDRKIFGSADVKNWYGGSAPPDADRAKLRAAVDDAAADVAARSTPPAKIRKVLVEGDALAFRSKCNAEPWFYAREESERGGNRAED